MDGDGFSRREELSPGPENLARGIIAIRKVKVIELQVSVTAGFWGPGDSSLSQTVPDANRPRFKLLIYYIRR